MRNLTKKQEEILDFIDRQIQYQGYPPSVREICNAVGFKSTSTVHNYLEVLNKKGYIFKDPSKPRALKIIKHKNKQNLMTGSSRLTSPVNELIDVPIIGKVTAGQPILAVENIEGSFPMPVEFAKNQEVFALTVYGESMIDAGIYDNDLIIVNKQNVAKNGDIVVALIDDEATVKRFYKEDGYFRLQPENKYMQAIILNDLIIIGKVIAVFRRID